MKLSIYSLRETLFDGEVTSVSLPTPLGEITVLDHHIPLVSIVSPGEIRCAFPNEAIRTFPFRGGILEIQPDSKAIILAQP